MSLVKLTIQGISYSQTQNGAYALILNEVDGDRKLPIVIGAFEAQSIAIALEKGAVKPDTNMVIGAKYLVGPKPITDTHPYGNLTVAQIIQKSSNIGTAKIAMNNLSQKRCGISTHQLD